MHKNIQVDDEQTSQITACRTGFFCSLSSNKRKIEILSSRLHFSLFFLCLQEFVDQFRVLLPRSATACKEDIAALLGKKMGLDPTTYQIGKTKVHQKQSQQPLGPIVASVQHLFILTEIKITHFILYVYVGFLKGA